MSQIICIPSCHDTSCLVTALECLLRWAWWYSGSLAISHNIKIVYFIFSLNHLRSVHCDGIVVFSFYYMVNPSVDDPTTTRLAVRHHMSWFSTDGLDPVR